MQYEKYILFYIKIKFTPSLFFFNDKPLSKVRFSEWGFKLNFDSKFCTPIKTQVIIRQK